MATEIPKLEDRLEKQSLAAREEMRTGLSQRMDLLLKTYERGRSIEEGLKKLYFEKTKEISAKILVLRERDRAANQEKPQDYYLKQQDILLDALSARFEMAITMAGGTDKKIGSFEELADFVEHGFQLLNRLDIKQIQAEGLDPEVLGEQIPADYILIATKLEKGETLTETEWQTVEAALLKIADAAVHNGAEAYHRMKQYPGFILVDRLKPADRLALMERVLDEKDAAKLLVTFAATNYLTIAQAEALAQKGAQNYPKNAADFNLALVELHKPELKKIQFEFEKIQKKAAQYLERNYAHNYAGKFLSVKGLLGWFGLKNFLFYTLALNAWQAIVVNKDPLSLVTNPAVLGGMGLLGYTGEIFTGGPGRGATTRVYAKWSKKLSGKGGEEEEKRMLARNEKAIRALGNQALAAEFYFHHADKLADVARRTELESKAIDQFTLKDLGLNYATLDKKYKALPEAELTTALRNFSSLLYNSNTGLGIKTPDRQREYINASRNDLGLTEFA